MEEDIFNFSSEDLADLNNGFDKQLSKTSDAMAQTLKKGRALCITERFDEALKIFQGIVDEDIECVAGYIGLLRVYSKDYSVYEGAEIEKYIRIIGKLGDGSESEDEEYLSYIKKRKEFLASETPAPAPATASAAKTAAVKKTAPVPKTANVPATDTDMPQGEILSKENAIKEYNKSKYKNAFPAFLHYAEKGDAEMQYYLGVCYENHRGTKTDKKAALYWIEKSAEAGYVGAQRSLASDYSVGALGLKKDKEKAFFWQKKAAEQGDAHAQNSLGHLYSDGEGTTKDPAKAVYWFKKSADQGICTAQYYLAKCYKEGVGTAKDLSKAFLYYGKSAEQNFLPAQTALGDCYYKGEGTAKNYEKAVDCYFKAANRGAKYAQYSLGWCYYHGQGVSKDKEKGIEWYKKAAKNGSENAKDELKKLGIKY